MKSVIFAGVGVRQAAPAGAAVLLLMLVFLLGGCGSSQDYSGSQPDESSVDNPGTENSWSQLPDATATGGDVLPGYTEIQCVAEMTVRYGNADTARQVCEAVRAGYGGAARSQQLADVLPGVEARLGATALAGASTPGGGNQGATQPGGGSSNDSTSGSGGGSGGDAGSGWDSGGIEINVPPAP